jgi:biotin carboxylase
MNQTLMFLGGGIHQAPAIKKAKELGIRTVLCDYNSNCPGRQEADVFYHASTNDFSALLQIGALEKIDGVLAYTADSAALTVAKLAERLQLPGFPSKAVETLIHKDLLRSFLKKHGFAVPYSRSFKNGETFPLSAAAEYQFPVIVKPVDASGSKGVALIHHPEKVDPAVQEALEYSRSRKVLVEEYIDAKDHQICGIGFLQDGNITVHHAGNQSFNEDVPNPNVPISSAFPLKEQDAHYEEVIYQELQRLFSLLHMKNGSFVYEARIGKDNKVYFLDISPRNGGDYMDRLADSAYGNDLMMASILAAVGRSFHPSTQHISERYWAHYCLHSQVPGILSEIKMLPEEGHTIEEVYYHSEEGETINPLASSADFIGVVIMSFQTKEGMNRAIQFPEKWLRIDLKKHRQKAFEQVSSL